MIKNDSRARRPLLRLSVATLSACAALLWTESRTTAGAAERQPVLWLAPGPEDTAARAGLAQAMSDYNAGRVTLALPLFEKTLADPVLGGYATLLAGRSRLGLGRTAEASEMASRVLATSPTGYLGEAALTLSADAAEAASDWPAVVTALQALVARRATAAPLFRLGRAAENTGQATIAQDAYLRVHYEFALATEAPDAAAAWGRLAGRPLAASKETLTQDIARAERLFNGRRYTDARKAFEPLRALAAGDERAMVDLRLAECDFHLKRYIPARDALRAYLDRAPSADGRLPRAAEAHYYYLGAVREMGRHDEYTGLVDEFIERYAGTALAESALNDLGTHYILQNDDAKAAAVFADQYKRFPSGTYADRAAWKAGWWAYKSGDFAETVRIFEAAATTLRRADYRPAWLYWAARSHLELGHREVALTVLRQVIADYRNSYYGREARVETEQILTTMGLDGAGTVSPAGRELPPTIVPDAPPANATLIRNLLAAAMYDEAIGELRAAARETRATPVIDATIAFALNRKGDLRTAITTMRRAYPQFMAEGGEALPADILTVIFPVDYWDLIHRQARLRNLDPFLMMALIAQESTFQADVRSAANAYGLMQVVPATGRRYAQTLAIRPFRTARLTEPEVNVRIGMAYFSDLVRQFGGVAAALAAYNAGEQRVARWVSERPGIARDEFIDDIPFPETQNYVKRILGTAEDYRLLYKNR